MNVTPEQVAASYDQIAHQWLDLSTYGFAQIERAVAFVKIKQGSHGDVFLACHGSAQHCEVRRWSLEK